MSADCQHIRELMDSYLSEELSVETNHLVLGHLASCPACASEVKRRQRLRTLLAQSFAMPLDADRVRQRIVDAVDREQHSWRRSARWWGLAAAVLIGVAITQWLAKPVDAAAYDDSAGNHIACALSFPANVTFDPARAARNLAPPFEKIADALGLTHGPYHVIDAHMCPYQGRDYAHVVLRGDGRTLSLFAERAVRGTLPSAPVTATLTSDAFDVHSTTRLGYHVSAVATAEHQLFLVTDRPADTPDEVANEILQSAIRFIRTLER